MDIFFVSMLCFILLTLTGRFVVLETYGNID